MFSLLQNLQIGTKLAIASALGVLLLGAMIASQTLGNASIREASQSALAQQQIARDAVKAEATVRGMQLAVRDIRLANSPADIQKATQNLGEQQKSTNLLVNEMLKLSHETENRARMENLRSLAANYEKAAQQIARIRGEAVAASGTDGATRAAKLNEDAIRIAREITLPIAGELDVVIGQIADYARHNSEEKNALAAAQMRSSEQLAILVGAFAALVLVCSWLMSFLTVARPIRALTVAMDKLADSFEAAIGEIVDTVSSAATELEASASTLTSTAARGQELTTMVAAASEEASTNVQSVASATEELSSSITEISRQVQESARVAGDAVSQARTTTDRVGELSAAAARIGDVVELINTIAGQTNLLALNATIEAARAGEAGRGFAVVASEVKALAEQTAKATGEIGQQIASIQTATDHSVGAIKDISHTIEKLSEISSTIAAAVEEQGAATQEISRNVQQAAAGTHQVSSNITDVQHGASETGSASAQVLAAAQSLSGDSNRLKLEVGKFLSTVRAA